MNPLLRDLDHAIAHNDYGALRQEQLSVPGVEPALRLALWLIDDARGATVSPQDLGGNIAPDLLERIVRLGQRHAWLAFDGEGVAAWADILGSASSCALMSRGVAALARGHYDDAFAKLGESVHHATQAQADHDCEARTWLALAALEVGNVQRALEEARHTTQLSKQRARVTDHAFASLTLARARRYAGHPHLSVFITNRLQKHASSRWTTWLEWERILAGDRDAFDHPRSITSSLAKGLMNMFRGDRKARTSATSELFTLLRAQSGPFVSDCLDLAALLDAGDRVPAASQKASAWIHGEGDQLPRGLEAASVSAFGGSPQGAQQHPIGVLAQVGAPPRRMMRTAEVDLLDIADDRSANQQRTLSAIAYTVLAGHKAIDFSSFFEDLYGFVYDPRRHQSVLDTLISRVRAVLEGRAELTRDDNALTLRVHTNFFCPDPRCEVSAKDHMLYILAQGGPATARGLAEHLGMPLRTVQEVLRELKESGACDAQRNGRVIEYSVEDSVYLEPTVTLPSFSLERR